MRDSLSDKLIRNVLGGVAVLAGALVLNAANLEPHVSAWFWYSGLVGFAANVAHGVGKASYNLSRRSR